MIFSILPLFLANTLGFSKTMIGLVQGLADAAGNIMKLFSGWFSDKLGKRKVLVLLGYTISTISKPLIAFSVTSTHIITARMADRIGKGIRTLLTESTTKETRGKWFGFDQAMDTAGAVLGTLLAYFLVSSYISMDYRAIFLLSVIPAIVALAIIILFVNDVARPKVKKMGRVFFLDFKSFSFKYKYFLVISTVFSMANFTYAFFLLKAQDIGFAETTVILLYLVYTVFYACLSIPAGKLSDRIGRRTVIVLGYILFFITCIGFIVLTEKKDIWILFAIYGIAIALTDSVSRAYIGDLAPDDKKASAQGIYFAFTGMALLAGALIAGQIWDRIGSLYTFVYAAAVSGIACIMLILGKPSS